MSLGECRSLTLFTRGTSLNFTFTFFFHFFLFSTYNPPDPTMHTYNFSFLPADFKSVDRNPFQGSLDHFDTNSATKVAGESADIN